VIDRIGHSIGEYVSAAWRLLGSMDVKRTRAVVLVAAACCAASMARGGEMIDAGHSFPKFELTAHDGSTVASGDLAGTPYLVYFYPKADTPGCTKEACAFRDSWAGVQAAGLRVFGVSYDKPETNRKFAEKYGLQFLLLSDRDKQLAEAVGAKTPLIPVPKRISYLVGADGTVLKAYPKVSPSGHAAEVLADLEALTE
jgi:peroxiredoxin Q/BCP